MAPVVHRAAAAACGVVALALAGAGSARASPASNLLYERALMSSAGGRCGLFAPGVAAALQAAREQARGAALRAGDSLAAVGAAEGRATARADAVDCRAPGLLTAASRVREAYADYARLSVMRFPGPRSAWRAERPDVRLGGARWRLVQALPGAGGWVLFGTVNGRPALLDARRGLPAAAGARMRLRDPARLDRPFLAGAPPAGVSQVFLASSKGAAARALLPAGAVSGVLYAFPQAMLATLLRLDPRETALAELVYPSAGRERVYAAPVEIGDLAAAEAFLAAAAKPAG